MSSDKFHSIKSRFFTKLNKGYGQSKQAAAPQDDIDVPIVHEVSEESLKKSIASKLERYRPLERQAKFTGPSYR